MWFEPFESARLKFDIRFYLVAILFVIFDLDGFFISMGCWFSAYWVTRFLVDDVVFIDSDDRFSI